MEGLAAHFREEHACLAEMTVSGVSLRCRLLDGHEDTGEPGGHGWVQVETSERGGA